MTDKAADKTLGRYKNAEYIPYSDVQEVLNEVKNSTGYNTDKAVAEAIGLSASYFTQARKDNRVRKPVYLAMFFLLSKKEHMPQIGMTISQAEAELIFVLCSLMKDKMSSRQAEIISLQQKMARHIAKESTK